MADYQIGSTVWNGLAKVIEEAAELQQVFAKIIGKGGDTNYWDVNLKTLAEEEIGDLYASLDFFVQQNLDRIDITKIHSRRELKLKRYRKWNEDK